MRSRRSRALAALAATAALAAPAPAGAAIRLRSRTIEAGPAGTAGEPPASGIVVLVARAGVGASLRHDLEERGVRLLGYVPDGALLADLDPWLAAEVARHPDLAAVVPLAPDDRVSPRVATPAWPDAPELAGLLVVQAVPGTDLAALAGRAAAGAARAKLVSTRAGGRLPRVTVRVAPGTEPEAARELAALDGVLWVEPAGAIRPLNDTSVWVGQSWDVAGQATPAFDHGLFGAGQIVGVSDTGLDADHAAFHDPARGLPGPVPDPLQRKVIAYHDRLGTGNWDSFNHGTHVAGIIAGDLDRDGRWDANGANQAPDGMAPAAKLAISDANDTDLPGNPVDLRELFRETYDDGARLHNNSWASCSCNEYTVHSQDVDEFLWETRDMAILFAAGNSGPGAGTVQSPGTAKNAITVGATERGAAADALAGFSSRGPAGDGRLKPTVTAPGAGIRSALGDRDVTTFNDGVAAFSGTSMATPTATGLLALVREYLAAGFYPTGVARAADSVPAPSAALLGALLVNSARSMAGHAPAPSSEQGWGRVLLDDVLHFAGDARRLWLEDDARGIAATGASRSFPLAVGPAAGDLKVTLAWTDPPAALLVGPALVNDLDLVVSGPGGTYRGNGFAAGWSLPGTAPDRTDVIEGVRLQAPPPGVWTVTVTGANVPLGPQPFALVATGDVAPAGRLRLAGHALADPDGDGDGTAEPGELVRLDVTLALDGVVAATGIDARLVPLVPWAAVADSDLRRFPDAAPGGTTASPAPWLLALDPDAPCDAPLPLALEVASSLGPSPVDLVLRTGAGRVAAAVLLADGFDGVAAGAPPDPARWTTGFTAPAPGGVAPRVAADPSVEPAGTAPPSPPHALYLGRDRSTNASTTSFAATRAFDLSGFDRATLTFRYWVRSLEGGIAARDGLAVAASADGGATFPLLLYASPDYVSGMDSASYPDRRWHDVTVDLAAAGLLRPGVAIRFEARVNSAEPQDAVYLDDVRLEAAAVGCDPGCIPPAFSAVAGGPVCAGAPVPLGAAALARGFGGFTGTWSPGDGSSLAVSPFDAPAAHVYPGGGSYAATLEAVSAADPSCRRAAGTTVEVDEPPRLVPRADPVCASAPAASLWAELAAPGHGPVAYTWDFGDGSPPLAVADPAVPVAHMYPAIAATWTATLRAEAARVAGCAATVPVTVVVADALPPAGAIGNALRAARAGATARLDWRAGPTVPATYNVHRTARRDRLVETAAVLGAEPVIARPTGSEAASDPDPPPPLWYYEVAPREACSGASVLP